MSNKRRGHKHAPRQPNKFARQGKQVEPTADSNGEERRLRIVSTGTKREHLRKEKLKRGGDGGKLLTRSSEVKDDLKLIERAVRSKWNIRRKSMIQKRLLSIVEKESVTVGTKFGPVEDEGRADANSVAASRVLVAMNQQDIDDEQFATKQKQPGNGVNINVVNLESGRSSIIQLAKRFGARELVIDGKSVQLADCVGEPIQAGTVQPDSSS